MRIAYARVSTSEQSLDLQTDALRRAGYDRLYNDHGVSGVGQNRAALKKALVSLNAGDTFIVWRLDRLARSMQELTKTVQSLNDRGVRFVSLNEHIDVNSAAGELILHVLCAVAHFERALIVERTKAGMLAAKERGVQIGRKPALAEKTLAEAIAMVHRGSSIPETAKKFGIGKSTLYRYLAGVEPNFVHNAKL